MAYSPGKYDDLFGATSWIKRTWHRKLTLTQEGGTDNSPGDADLREFYENEMGVRLGESQATPKPILRSP